LSGLIPQVLGLHLPERLNAQPCICDRTAGHGRDWLMEPLSLESARYKIGPKPQAAAR
jgi:hypothetical protein